MIAGGEKAQSKPNETRRSKTAKTRRRANATCKENPSVTRFPVHVLVPASSRFRDTRTFSIQVLGTQRQRPPNPMLSTSALRSCLQWRLELGMGGPKLKWSWCRRPPCLGRASKQHDMVHKFQSNDPRHHSDGIGGGRLMELPSKPPSLDQCKQRGRRNSPAIVGTNYLSS
jgi:hypothetical protein